MTVRRRLVVTGRVQNVFYRDWLIEQALALGIDGWVRNRADGSVEAVAAGAAEQVDALIARAREGSPASRVAEVTVSDDVAPVTLAASRSGPPHNSSPVIPAKAGTHLRTDP